MGIRIIKTKQQYRRYLNEVHRLVRLDPDPACAGRRGAPAEERRRESASAFGQSPGAGALIGL